MKYGVYKSSFLENYEIKEDVSFPDTFFKNGTYYLQEIFDSYDKADRFIDKRKENSDRSRIEDNGGSMR